MNKTKLSLGVIFITALAVVIIVPVVIVTTSGKANAPTTTDPVKKPYDLSKLTEDEKSRINCFLEEHSRFENLTEYQCVNVRGCIYKPSEYEKVPTCFFNRTYLGYEIVANSMENSVEKHILLRNDRRVKHPYLGSIDNLTLTLEYLGENIIHVKITDSNNERYEVPYPLNKPPILPVSDQPKHMGKVIFTKNNGLSSFQVVRSSDSNTLFDTSFGGFVFSDQFIQISTYLNKDSPHVYGFGENNHESLLHDFNYTSWGMFGRDNAPGWGDNRNNYGFQPVYLSMEKSGKSHLVLLYNSNAMETLFTPSLSLTYRTIGGVLDFYFIIDESPEGVLQHYHNLIGKPMFPPYWSLGFQISRWGYEKLDDVKDVIQRNKDIKIPQDVQYVDIEYMIGYRDFTVDQKIFSGLGKFVDDQEKLGLKFVLILDPGIVMETNNSFYMKGIQKDIFVKWPEFMTPYDRDALNLGDVVSWCWPNAKISYPDFLNDKTHDWWYESFLEFTTNKVNGTNMAGIWIDMNEPSSFETNEIKPWNWMYPANDQDRYPYFALQCPPNKYDDPPYRTKSAFVFDGDDVQYKKAKLSQKTLCMISQHEHRGKKYKHYDVHNLYAHAQSIATYNAFSKLKPNLRPFSLTRSNFVGTGHYAAHWLGDNDSTWKHMRMSIIGLIEYNIFGMPMIGADICGFFIDIQDPEMCTRWLQLGAFYTFSRNHNANKNIAKDPASFKNKILEESTRDVLKIRYSILPYIYTYLYKVNQNGGSVIKPLFFDFTSDMEARKVERQFLLGSSLLVSPVLEKGQTKVNAYFPDSIWYDFRKGSLIEKTKWQELDAPLSYINLHLKGGSILPIQDPIDCLNTECSRKNPLSLIIALDSNKKASGSLFWDDGISELATNKYFLAEFNYENKNLSMSVTKNTLTSITNDLSFDSLKIYGYNEQINSVSVNNQLLNPANIFLDMKEKVLKLTNLKIQLVDFYIQFN